MRHEYKDEPTGAVVKTARDVDGGGHWISGIKTPHRETGQGGATRCMHAAIIDADKECVRLRLWVCPSPDTQVRRRLLREWYRTFGFVHIGDDIMIREPRCR